MAGPTCARALHFGTPLTRSGPHRELHRRNLLQGPHAFPPLTSVHPSHASRPNSELDRRPQWQGPRVSPPLISAHPSRLSWPHKELHRRPQWQGSHASAPLIPARPSHACFVALRSPYKDLVIRQPPPIHATMRPVLSAARCLWRGPVPTVFVICSPSYFQGEPPEFARRPRRCSHWDTDSVLCSRGSRGRTSRGNCPLRSEAWQGSQPTADHHGRPWQTTAARQTTGTQEHGRPAMQITRSRQTNTVDVRFVLVSFVFVLVVVVLLLLLGLLLLPTDSSSPSAEFSSSASRAPPASPGSPRWPREGPEDSSTHMKTYPGERPNHMQLRTPQAR